jgi:hypothetical protein
MVCYDARYLFSIRKLYKMIFAACHLKVLKDLDRRELISQNDSYAFLANDRSFDSRVPEDGFLLGLPTWWMTVHVRPAGVLSWSMVVQMRVVLVFPFGATVRFFLFLRCFPLVHAGEDVGFPSDYSSRTKKEGRSNPCFNISRDNS